MGLRLCEVICVTIPLPIWANFLNIGYLKSIWLIVGDLAMQNDQFEMDRFDRAILRALAGDGRMSITDLAKQIGLSKSPTQARLRRLEKAGVITGYRAQVDPIRLGHDHVSFVRQTEKVQCYSAKIESGEQIL